MKLTERQRQILEGLAYAESRPERDDTPDLVESGGEAWFGLECTSIPTIMFFLRNCLVRPEDEAEIVKRYEITDWGRRVLEDPNFEPQDELKRLNSERSTRGWR